MTSKQSDNNVHGFTLVELVIAMGVSVIVIAALYAAYSTQQRHHTAQTQVVEMQQNIRAAMTLISRDIRMIGYDPSGNANSGIEEMEQDCFHFTIDFNEDGDTNDAGEHIAYDLYVDGTTSTLGRAVNDPSATPPVPPSSVTCTDQGGGHYESTSHEAVAQVIEALEFEYLDSDGNVTANANEVRTVVISMLARAEQDDPNFTNAQTYDIGGPWPQNDNFRRRFHQMTIQGRNLGF